MPNELIAGYWILQLKSMDEAVEWSKRFLQVLGTGECELRPIFEASDFPADLFPPQDASREPVMREEMQRKTARP